jgi:serine/threonine protein kinase
VAWVIHLGESGGNYFYVMEFVEGETLGKFIRGSGRLDPALALQIVEQIAGLQKRKTITNNLELVPTNRSD